MAFYAFDPQEEFISANEADPGMSYSCISCKQPVKRRRGKFGFFHFYHLLKSPQCRLYSHKEDHFLAQIQIQKLFKKKELQLEKPFIQIDRVADACIESKKIVFEIQCSPISESEVKKRVYDYRSLGYEVIWLLDDKRFNKRILRPAEKFLRSHLTYYISIQRGHFSQIYDQFEIFHKKRRVKKGKRLTIDLTRVYINPTNSFEGKPIPKQVRELKTRVFCFKDRTYLAKINPTEALNYWRKLEKQYGKSPNLILLWLKTRLLVPYQKALTKYLTQAH